MVYILCFCFVVSCVVISELLVGFVLIISIFSESLLMMWLCWGKFVGSGGLFSGSFEISVLLFLMMCCVSVLWCCGQSLCRLVLRIVMVVLLVFSVFLWVVLSMFRVSLLVMVKLFCVRLCVKFWVVFSLVGLVWWLLIIVSCGCFRVFGVFLMYSSGGVLVILVSSVGYFGLFYISRCLCGFFSQCRVLFVVFCIVGLCCVVVVLVGIFRVCQVLVGVVSVEEVELKVLIKCRKCMGFSLGRLCRCSCVFSLVGEWFFIVVYLQQVGLLLIGRGEGFGFYFGNCCMKFFFFRNVKFLLRWGF